MVRNEAEMSGSPTWKFVAKIKHVKKCILKCAKSKDNNSTIEKDGAAKLNFVQQLNGKGVINENQ